MAKTRKKKAEGVVQGVLPLGQATDKETIPLEDTYRDYFLQYASYVIMDRAIPEIGDGCKPVQRRLLHAMKVMDDGRFHKVANIIGQCMQYHPHGDSSIGSALVGMGQKNLLVDTQGNWGDPITGDPAAAARYIEARLSKFAKDVLYAPHMTEYKLTYDGRKKEPITLPARYPILLATGTEGIAVGLSTRVLPHNFIEILEAMKAHLREEAFELFPDFPTGGQADVGEYNNGVNGARIRCRACITQGAGKDLVISEIPYGVTTASLIDSIIAAGDKGKIKLSRIEDNSAAAVEIHVYFQRGVNLDRAVDALYAFTDCEVSHSPNGMVIKDGKPQAMGVTEMVIHGAEQTRHLLKLDLEYKLDQLEIKWHHKSLVQIFIENRVYLRIEKCKTWESVLMEIDQGLEPFKKKLRRMVFEEDLVMLTEVKMRRISAWDAERAREELLSIEKEIKKLKKQLKNLTQYTIDWFDYLRDTYGEGRERKTSLVSFDTIKAVTVVERTEKLYVDRSGGFVGTGLKNAEEVGPCSSIDDIIAFVSDGSMQVVRAEDKIYVGERILHTQVFKPDDKEKVFNMVYEDQESGKAWAKRFTVGGITRDKPYNLCANAKKPRVLFFKTGGEIYLHVKLKKKPRIRTEWYYNLADQIVKGRGAGGNVLSKHQVSSIRTISKQAFEKLEEEEE